MNKLPLSLVLVFVGLLGLDAGSPSSTGLSRAASLLPLLVAVTLMARGRRSQSLSPMIWLLTIASVTLALMQQRLGIPGSDRFSAGLLYLAGSSLMFSTVPGVTKLIGEFRTGKPLKSLWPSFVLPFVFFATLAPWTVEQRTPDGDEPWYLLITHSLVHDLDHDLLNNYLQQDSLEFMPRSLEPQPGDPGEDVWSAARSDDNESAAAAAGPTSKMDAPRGSRSVLSRHGALLPLVLAPAYAIGGYHAVVGVMIFFAAALCGLVVLVLASERTTPSTAPHSGQASYLLRSRDIGLAWALTALTAPLLLFSTQVWVEVPAALLLLVAYRSFQVLKSRDPQESGVRPLVILGVTILLLPALKLRFGVLSVSLLVLLAWKGRLARRHRNLLLSAGALGLIAILVYNQLAFSNPLRIHQWNELLISPQVLPLLLLRLFGLFYDCAFGLFAAAPLWMLIIPGAALLCRKHRPAAANYLLLMGPYLLLVASRIEWYGGWSPPFRYPLVLLPFFALLAAVGLQQRKSVFSSLLLPPLVGVSLALGALWTAMPGWTYNFANGSSYLVDQWSSLSGVDWARLLPSATRVTLASWLFPILFTLALVVGYALSPKRERSGLPKHLGLAIALGLVVVATSLARTLPTKVIQGESAVVLKTGGHPEPTRWINNRTRFREGWTIRHGERLTFPIRPGSERVEIKVAFRFFRNRSEDMALSLLADARVIAGMRLSTPDQWLEESFGPIDWGDAETLSIVAGPPLRLGSEPGVVNGVAIDWVELTWK